MRKQSYLITPPYLIVLLFLLFSYLGVAQNYSPLYTESAFNDRSVDVNLPVGTLSGSAATSEGSASYTIPIKVAPGSNGMVPSVAVSYNSMGGSAIAGYGWNISAASAITRVGQNIYFDGKTRPLKLDNQDRLVLDGQRLITKSGTYLANNSTYGKEMEDYSTVTAHGQIGSAPEWFEVVVKDGTKYEYGHTSDARTTNSSNNQVFSWYLNKVTRTDGNYMKYVYRYNGWGSGYREEMLIDRIEYTGNLNVNRLPYNTINFYYNNNRIDKNEVYQVGTKITSKKLLEKIQVKAENQFVREYKFKYANDGVNSFLKEVIEYGSDYAHFNSTIFKYGDKPVEFEENNQVLSYSNNSLITSGDFDGDGISEVLEAPWNSTHTFHTKFLVHKRNSSTGNYTSSSTYYFPSGSFRMLNNVSVPIYNSFRTSDFTGDNKDDVLVLKNQGNNFPHFILYKSTSNVNSISFNQQTILSSPPSLNGFNFTNFNEIRFAIGDFDGDGSSDFIYLMDNGFDPNSGLYEEHLFISYPRKGIYNKVVSGITPHGKYSVIDITGNGKSELMVSSNNHSWIYEFTTNGNTTTAASIYSSTYPTTGHWIYYGDFNGDGKTDMLTRSKTNNSAQWHIAYSKGSDFVVLPFNFTNTPDITGMDDDDKLIIGDFNGDGKTDIYHGRNFIEWTVPNQGPPIYTYHGGNKIYYSKGQNSFVSKYYDGSLIGDVPALPFDLNGDGRLNVVNRKKYSGTELSYFFNKNGTNLLLEKVKNGLNHETKWEYKRMNEQLNPIYFRTKSGQYPNTTLSSSMNLVESIKVPDGIIGDNEQTFGYRNAYVNSQGKGYLGLAHTGSIMIKTNTNVTTDKILNSSPPTLVPESTRTFDGTNLSNWNYGLISKSRSTGQFIQIGNSKRYKYQLISSQVDNMIERKRVITNNLVYDGYGNIKSKTEKVYWDKHQTGSTPVLKQTTVTTSTYGTFNTPVPAKATQIITTTTRTNETPFTTKTTFQYYTWGAPYQLGMLRYKKNYDNDGHLRSYQWYRYVSRGLWGITSFFKKLNSSGFESRWEYNYWEPKSRYLTSKKNAIGQHYDIKILVDIKTGNVLLEKGISGLNNGYDYDGFGRLEKTKIYAPGSTTNVDIEATKSYHWQGNASDPKSVFYIENHHPAKPDTKVWYDIVGRETKTETEGFQNKDIITETNYSYWGNHNANEVEKNGPYKSGETAMSVKTQYDIYGRVTKIIKPFEFGITNYSYDQTNDGFKTTITTPDGNQTSQVVDPTGKVLRSTDNGGTLKYYYYSHGNIKRVKKGSITLVYNQYDAYGRQTSMLDKNAGTTDYIYDNFGQLVSQTTANGNTSTMKYDKLGRMTEKVYFEGKTKYEYYPSNSGAKTNQLKKVTKFIGTGTTIGSSTEFNYTTRGLMNWKRVKIPSDNLSLISHYYFNNYGDMTSMTYPSGFGLKYELDGNGYLKKIKKNGTSYTIFENKGMNGYNQLTKYKVGNLWYGPEMNITYEYGIPKRYYDIRPWNVGNQDLEMKWDYETGNLEYRWDKKKNRKEEFVYDPLNRLISSEGATGVFGTGIQTINTTFATNGNITSKTDAGTYFYQSPKINAVTGIYTTGNAIPAMTQDITYTSFLQPKHISEGTYTLDYIYGADEQRIKSITKDNNYTINARYYFDGWERDISLGVKRDLHYISAGGRLIAIVERRNGTDYYHYTYTDHLGSILATCAANGQIDSNSEQNFDAWGRKRNPSTWAYSDVTDVPVWLYRGYTGHEGLKNFRLINMNGRMYDPAVGRMLSVDNYIQADGYSQSYNRYSYAFNNPLKYNDPDGEWIAQAIGAVIGGYSGYQIGKTKGATGLKMVAYVLGGAAVGALSGGLGNAISTSGVAFANTTSIVFSSSTNSFGMFMLSGGTTDLSVSFGVGSYNFSRGELGYLGKKGNSKGENIGYAFGALANVQDIVAGTNGTSIDVRSRKDLVGHSEINNVKNGEDILVSVGPDHHQVINAKNDLMWEAEFLKLQLKGQTAGGRNSPMIGPNSPQFRIRITNVNRNILTKMTSNLNNGRDLLGLSRLKYGLGFGCVNYTSRALLYSGIPTINAFLPLTSPVLLNFELAIRQAGIYASPFLINKF